QRRMTSLPGFGQLSAWAKSPILPSIDALGLVVRFLARQYGADVMGVDVGGDSTSMFSLLQGQFRSLVRSGVGVGTGTLGIWEQAGAGAITRWLPYELAPNDLRNRLENKRLRPVTIPQTREDLLLELALSREALRLVVSEARLHGAEVDILIAGGGGLRHAMHYGQSVLVLLDALQPVGVTRVWLDNLSLLPQLGALAALEPMAAGQVTVRDTLLPLGTLICPVRRIGGRLVAGREGQTALRFRITYAQGGSLDVEVPAGTLEMVPLPLGQQATLDLHPARGYDIGLGPNRAGQIEVDGGVLGLVIDARGRPLALPTNEIERRKKIREWLLAVGG
ncbi:MAG: glutamate mutase L, partial [Chloroflexi bacterium]|nr:glutamate mutase L [Chloroflexota bacterium]